MDQGDDRDGALDAGDGPPPVAGRLLSAAPNPFNPRTVIAFELDRSALVELFIVDLAGHHVTTLVASEARS